MRKKKTKELKITLWQRSSRAFIYYVTLALLWFLLFKTFFTLRDVFRALDVVTAVMGRNLIYFLELPKSAACLTCFWFFVKYTDLFAGVLLNMYRLSKQDKKLAEIGSSVGVDGVQGVGKTRVISYFGMMLLHPRWEELRYKYFVDCPVAKELKEKYDKGERAPYVAFDARRYSVQKYKEESKPLYDENGKLIRNAIIPLIYSNIEITYNGAKERELKREHFTMEERLLESNIKLASELDNLLPNTMRRVKQGKEDDLLANRIDEFSGLDRQYTGGVLIADTHRNGALFLPIRDCQQVKYHLIESHYLYTPKFLKKLLKFFKKRVLKKEEQTTLRLRKICKKLEELVRSIGFTKVFYYLESGPAGATVLNKNEKLFFLLPNQVPYAYNDRALQEQYPPLDHKKDDGAI